MAIYVRESSTWREIEQPYVRTAGVWRTITNQSVKDAGTWRPVFPTQGQVYNWGNNSRGQLGTNDLNNRSTPVTTFAGGTNWKQISAGALHTAGIKTDGTLWIWGWNFYGQLGINLSTNANGRTTPVTTFAGGTNWKQVYCGSYSTAAIKTDGTLWTWGSNYSGILGVNEGVPNINRLTPTTTFAGGTNWKQVSVGNGHMAAIKTDGTLWTWGSNYDGGLGTNDTTQRITPVTTFAGGTNWKQVFASVDYTAAIKTDGTLWTWGNNYSRQLGINNNLTRCTPVTTFAGGTNWKQVSASQPSTNFFMGAGAYTTSAIKTDGTLWTWGGNAFGQLGINTSTGFSDSRCTPVTTFAGGTNWKQVSGAAPHVAAIKTDGTLWTWGQNYSGQLGINNTQNNRCTPVTTFAGGTNWKQVSAGGEYTATII